MLQGLTGVQRTGSVQFAGKDVQKIKAKELVSDTYRGFLNGRHEATNVLMFQNQQELDQMWPALLAKTNLRDFSKPQVDFSKEVLLLVASDEDSGKDNANNRIESVTYYKNKRMLKINFKYPEPSYADVVRQTWALVTVPKSVSGKTGWFSIGGREPMEARTGQAALNSLNA